MSPLPFLPVEISFEEEEGKPVRPLEQSDAGINPCIVNGVEGKLTIEKEEDLLLFYQFLYAAPSMIFPHKHYIM